MLNNFFPALNQVQADGSLSSEEIAAMQLQQAALLMSNE
jgi:hypothetical protein